MNILFTSAGRRSYLISYFKQALKGKGLIHAGNSEMSPALMEADMHVITPFIFSDEYVPFLIDYAIEHKVKAIISLFDIDLAVLAKHKKTFAAKGIQVIVSDPDAIDICNDKWLTNQFLVQNNFNAPKTFLSLPEAQNSLQSNQIQFPLVVKPRWGMGSIGVFIANDQLELEVFYNKAMHSVKNTYLHYLADDDFEQSIIIQEMLKGQEYGLDVLNDFSGNYVTTVVKKKLAMRSGETDRAITEKDEMLEQLGETLASKLQHIGNLDVDCFVSDQGITILELNPRFGGGYPFSHLAGVNFPEAYISWLQGTVPNETNFTYLAGIEMLKEIIPLALKPFSSIKSTPQRKPQLI